MNPKDTFAIARRGIVAALLATAVAAPAWAQQSRLPPVNDPATAEHHAGKVVFVELVTPDLMAAKHFYGSLFGWTFNDLQAPGMKYAEALLDGRPVGGLMERDLPANAHRRPSWLTFLSVPDTGATRAAAVQLGGKVLFEPRDVPDRGAEAVFADPQGAVFAVLTSSSGDPPDLLAEPGEWIWSALITSDPDGGATFYKTLFGDELFDLPATAGHRHILLATDGYARASVNSLPVSQPDEQPYWLNFVRVKDATAMAHKAVALGGRIIVEPRIDRHGGKVAVVSDPGGAVFGLMEWETTDSKKVSR